MRMSVYVQKKGIFFGFLSVFFFYFLYTNAICRVFLLSPLILSFVHVIAVRVQP